jgi:hypothetical protein
MIISNQVGRMIEPDKAAYGKMPDLRAGLFSKVVAETLQFIDWRQDDSFDV